MQIFLDTSDVEEIRYVNRELENLTGRPLDGVTTNPTSMAEYAGQHSKHPMDVAKYIGDLIGRNVSVETIGTDVYDPEKVYTGRLEEEGRTIAEAHPAFVVKVPSLLPGYYAAWRLHKRGIPVNMTLVFDDFQGLWAGRVGAHYVSPFAGRIDSAVGDGEGTKTAEKIAEWLKNKRYSTQVLFASVRHPGHVDDAHRIGSHVVTIPADVMRDMLDREDAKTRFRDYRSIDRAHWVRDAVQLRGPPLSHKPEDVMQDGARRKLLLDGNRRFIEDAKSVDYGHQMFGYPSVL